MAEGLLFSVRGVSVPREALHAQDETASHASAVGPGSLKGKSEAGEALSKPGIPVGGSGRSLKHQVGRTRQTARWRWDREAGAEDDQRASRTPDTQRGAQLRLHSSVPTAHSAVRRTTCRRSTWTLTPPTTPFLKAASISSMGLNRLPLNTDTERQHARVSSRRRNESPHAQSPFPVRSPPSAEEDASDTGGPAADGPQH